MPLIRYDVGDMAVLGPKKCKCGNPLPTLKKITGKICCFFRREDGTLIEDEYFVELFTHRELAKAFRIIQEDYKRIRIKIVPREKTLRDSEKREIETKIKMVMGRDCKVIWEVVNEIPKTGAGKYLPTQSLITE
jgi:phenylacetate-CoA ligase